MAKTTTWMILLSGEAKGVQPQERIPTETRWYCGIDIEDDGFHNGGSIAQWNGEEFVDEDGESLDMNAYDYLAEQY